MLKNYLLVICTLLTTTTGCLKTDDIAEQALAEYLTSIDYEVISVALNVYVYGLFGDNWEQYNIRDSDLTHSTSLVNMIVIDDSTTGHLYDRSRPEPHDINERLSNSGSTRDKLAILNDRKYRIDTAKITTINTVSLSRKESNKIFTTPSAGWEKFYRRFPSALGTFSFSRPAYNNEMNEAIMYLEMTRASLWGSDDTIGLKKVDGKWVFWKLHNHGKS